MSVNALGTALSSFVGQNFGAKRFDRISEGFKRTLEIGLIYSVITMVVCFFTGKYMALIFVDAADHWLLSVTLVKFIKLYEVCLMPGACTFVYCEILCSGYGIWQIFYPLRTC